jgi:hypothetical protein
MPKVVGGGKVWHGVQLQTAYSITGGHLHKPMTVPITEFVHDGAVFKATKVSSVTDWLCRMTANRCYSYHPLARCTVFRTLSRKLAEAARGTGEPEDQPDKLDALAFDDEPVSQRARKKSIHWVRQQSSKVAAIDAPRVAEISVRDCPSAVAEGRRLLAVQHGKDLYLELDGISWLANYIREELPTGGVQPVQDDGPAVAGPRIHWDWRDEVWVFRPQRGEEEETPRKVQRRPVRTRMMPGGDLHHLDFEAAKRVVYNELVELTSSDASDAMESGDSQRAS